MAEDAPADLAVYCCGPVPMLEGLRRHLATRADIELHYERFSPPPVENGRPFTVTTGKRVYRNMLIRALGVITDARSENALMVLCGLQEIKIVSTQTTSTGSDTAGAGQSGDQASPQTTGGTTNGGDQQGLPITGSEFAGSFNPGGFNTDGGSLGNGSFGSLGTPGMDGLSSGPTAELGELQIDGIDNDNRPQGVEASPYNVFGS